MKNIHKKQSIAIFGGSFNPPHKKHLETAKEILEKNFADEVWFIPCGNHAFGKKLANSKDRIRMLELITKYEPKLKISEIEIGSSEKSYSSETIKKLQEKFPDKEFSFVVGSDNIEGLEKWKDFEYLKENVDFLIVPRKGFNIPQNMNIKVKGILEEKEDISSTKVRYKLDKDEAIDDLVPANVSEYLNSNKTYISEK